MVRKWFHCILWFPLEQINTLRIQYLLPICNTMIVCVINYCCDILRSQLLATFGELASSSMYTAYVAAYAGEIINVKKNAIVQEISQKMCM
jgi:hypothetical protein